MTEFWMHLVLIIRIFLLGSVKQWLGFYYGCIALDGLRISWGCHYK